MVEYIPVWSGCAASCVVLYLSSVSSVKLALLRAKRNINIFYPQLQYNFNIVLLLVLYWLVMANLCIELNCTTLLIVCAIAYWTIGSPVVVRTLFATIQNFHWLVSLYGHIWWGSPYDIAIIWYGESFTIRISYGQSLPISYMANHIWSVHHIWLYY
jgi:hypothetical protein